MSIIWTSPLGPVLWLLAGAGLLKVVLPYLQAGRRRWAASAWIAIALLAWVALRFQSEQAPLLWQWRIPLELETVFGFYLDSWAWFVGLSILVIAGVTLLFAETEWRPGDDFPLWTMLLAAAALLSVLSISWLNLLGAWLLIWLMAGAVIPAPGNSRIWTTGIVMTALLEMTALWEQPPLIWQLIPATTLNLLPQLFLLLASGLALTAYPFHLSSLNTQSPATSRSLALHMIPALAALHLLGHFSLPLLSASSWLFFIMVALLGSSLVAWAETDSDRAWRAILINRSTWVLLLAALIDASPPHNIVLPLAILVLGAVMWYIARIAQERYRWQLPFWLAAAIFYGVPLTPGFNLLGFWHRLTDSVIGIPLWLIYLLAQTMFVAAFLRPWFSSSRRPKRLPRAFSLGVTILMGLTLAWGLFPSLLWPLGTNLPPSLREAALFAPLRMATLIDWITLVLPLGLGAALSYYYRSHWQELRLTRERVAYFASLAWLYRAGEQVLHFVAALVGVLADILDGAGQFGWVLLAILITYILLQS